MKLKLEDFTKVLKDFRVFDGTECCSKTTSKGCGVLLKNQELILGEGEEIN